MQPCSHGCLAIRLATERGISPNEAAAWAQRLVRLREQWESRNVLAPADEFQAVQALVTRALRTVSSLMDADRLQRFADHLSAILYSEGCRKVY